MHECGSVLTCVNVHVTKTPLNRGTSAIPLLFLSHEKETTHSNAFKWCTYTLYVNVQCVCACICVLHAEIYTY